MRASNPAYDRERLLDPLNGLTVPIDDCDLHPAHTIPTPQVRKEPGRQRTRFAFLFLRLILAPGGRRVNIPPDTRCKTTKPIDRSKSLTTHGRTIHWVINTVFAMSGRRPVYRQLRKDYDSERTDVEGHAWTSRPVPNAPKIGVGCNGKLPKGRAVVSAKFSQHRPNRCPREC